MTYYTVAPHRDWLSYRRNQLTGRISQNTNTWIKEFKTQSCPELSRCVHQCQSQIVEEAGLSAPSFESFDKTIESTPGAQHVPCASVLCHQYPCCVQKTFIIFYCDSAKLKLTLGSCIFTRFLNVLWMRSRTLVLRCPTAHDARQRCLYSALAVFDCRLVVLFWRWPEALWQWGCVPCCWPMITRALPLTRRTLQRCSRESRRLACLTRSK